MIRLASSEKKISMRREEAKCWVEAASFRRINDNEEAKTQHFSMQSFFRYFPSSSGTEDWRRRGQERNHRIDPYQRDWLFSSEMGISLEEPYDCFPFPNCDWDKTEEIYDNLLPRVPCVANFVLTEIGQESAYILCGKNHTILKHTIWCLFGILEKLQRRVIIFPSISLKYSNFWAQQQQPLIYGLFSFLNWKIAGL